VIWSTWLNKGEINQIKKGLAENKKIESCLSLDLNMRPLVPEVDAEGLKVLSTTPVAKPKPS
jgi:hypothetical protein